MTAERFWLASIISRIGGAGMKKGLTNRRRPA